MLIPSIDLKGGKVVQLVQGERLAIESDDLDGWIARFARFPRVQLIDLDAATGAGANDALIRQVCGRLPCQVGGGVRTPKAAALGIERLIGAVDSKGGRVVIHGWKTPVALSAVEAVRTFEPFCGEFLYTHVDTEGLMGGIPMEAVMAVRRATSRRLIAAGGIRTQAEIDALDAAGVDAVVGMAIYTGALALDGG